MNNSENSNNMKNMNIINNYVAKSPLGGFRGLWGLLIFLALFSCKNQDSTYEEYLVPNGLVYPGKALDAAAYPGKRRIEISWKNGADPNVVKASISWNNDTESAEVSINPDADVISRMIEPIAENTYSFMIRTFDAKGNASVPVEVIGTAYGARYESSLTNRGLKSVIFDETESSLQIEWNASTEAAETGVELSYTDAGGVNRTLEIDRSETGETIFVKPGEPVSYKTIYKPDPLSIDVFYAPEALIPYYANITDKVLENTVAPFVTGTMLYDDRWYEAAGWTANAAAAINGNVDTYAPWLGGVLGFFVWETVSPALSIMNGKLYQTVELEAGTYRFDAYLFANTRPSGNPKSYVVVALGNDLPDTDDTPQMALGYVAVPPPPVAADANLLLSVEFHLTEKTVVSLGFVATCGNETQLFYSKVELWKQF